MKMKNIFKKSYLVIILIASFFVSCSDDDNNELFNEAPSERVDARINELQSLLVGQANNGYKAVYFTKNDQRGGFTLFMKFNADGSVRQTSDFDGDTDLANSSYEVSLGTAVELVFTTRNHITKGTDPETVVEVINTRPAPQGFYGTSVFQYFSNDNGVLTFRDVRNKDTATLTLTPTNFTDFDTESVASVNKSLANRESFTAIDCATTSVYSVLSLTIDDTESSRRYDLNYEENTFFAKPSRFDNQGDVDDTEEFGIAFKEDGLQISPALVIGGNSFENFILNQSATGNVYVSTLNGATATISNERVSAPTGEDILDLPSLVYFYDVADGTNPLLSTCFQELVLDQINSNLDNRFGPGTLKFSFYAVFLDLDGNCSNLAIWVEDTAGDTYRANYCLGANIEDNKLFFGYFGGYGGANDAFFEPDLAPLIEFFTGPSGLLYTNEGPFTASLSSYTNLSGSFTSLDDESLRSYGLFF